MIEDVKVAVLGGGVTGLCVAHYVAEALGDDSVVLIESADHVGGRARTDRVDGFTCDWGPNGFLDREPKTVAWLEALGLGEVMRRANENAAHRFILKNDALVEVHPPPKFLTSSLLSIPGRARLFCEPFIPAKRDDAPESIWDFAARRIGAEAADMMVAPMARGIFGGDAKQLSLQHCFPRMAEMERDYGGLVKALFKRKKEAGGGGPMGPRGVLTTCAGGIGLVAERAAERLGDRIHTGTKATRLGRDGGTLRIETDRELSVRAAQVVVAMPAFAAKPLLAEFDSALADALGSIAYADIAVVCTGYARERVGRDLDGFGMLYPPNQDKRVLGCIWSSSIFPDQAPEGAVLLRSMIGGYNDPQAVALSDAELIDCVARDVHPRMGIDSKPDFVRVFRHRQGIPQYLLSHGEHLATIEVAEARHPGLIFAGNAYRGVGMNDCVVSAYRAVERVTQ
jgi:oxygen-dependent protoporphyrinogen oxidase